MRHDYICMTAMFLFRGADPRAVDEQGKSALQLAVESSFDDNEVLTILSEAHG